jgi:diphthine synthase
MVLFFISIGLNDEKDMSIKAIGIARSCDKLFAELYTSKLNTNELKLEEFIGKDIIVLSRQDLEENFQKILDEAKDKKVGLLVGGDAFISTTHSSLMLEAKKQNIEVKVIHGSSIISAVCESGLHIQKFGQIITIPFLERTKGRLPLSIYKTILENKKRGLHTLCLLDIISEENRFMSVNEALNVLLNLENKVRKKVISRSTELVVFSRLGDDSQNIVYGTIEELINLSFGEPPHTIVLVGNLHFSERECLKYFRIKVN